MRTQRRNQHTLAIELSHYVHPWPSHKTRTHPIPNPLDPLPTFPNYPTKRSTKALIEYHHSVINLAYQHPEIFDAKQAQLEIDRLKTTLEWAHSLSPQKEKKKVLDVIFNQMTKRPGYNSGSRIADCFGLTYLHWQILCEKTSAETIISPTYWKPILDRCLHFRTNWLGTIKFDFTDDDKTAERDLQDLLFWAYQEQQLASETNDRTRLQRANKLLGDIYQAAQTTMYSVSPGRSPYRFDDHNRNRVIDRHGRTLLYWAILCRQSDTIEALWQNPLNHWMLHKRTCYGYDFTPLDLAVHMGDLEMVQRLIKMGANPNNQNVQSDPNFRYRVHMTPLQRAVRMGRLDLVQILVENGANIDQKAFGYTPLYWAINMHEWEMAEYLLQKGASPEGGVKALWEGTPLHTAIEAVPAAIDFDWDNREQYPAYRVTKLLLEKGAHIGHRMRCDPAGTYGVYFDESDRCKSIHLLHELINEHQADPSSFDEYVYYTDSDGDDSRFNADNPQAGMTREQIVERAETANFYRNIHRGLSAFRDQQWGNAKYYFQTAAENPDLFLQLFFIHLIHHYISLEKNILIDPDQIRLLRELDSKEAIDLVHLLVAVPAVRKASLHSEDPRHAAMVWNIAKRLKIPLNLHEERALLSSIIEKSQIPTLPTAEAEDRKILIEHYTPFLKKINPDNDINREMMDLVHYFKNWRLKNASNSVVRFFKEKKTNEQREEQLGFLETMRHIDSDEIKLGALITLSQEIDQEWNVFDSELKKQVDAIIERHLEDIEAKIAPFTLYQANPTLKNEPSKKQPLDKKKQKALKDKCLKAYREHRVREQTQAAKIPKAFEF